MGKHASALGADTFAFFTRNPRGGAAKAIDPADASALMEYLGEHHFGTLVAHAPRVHGGRPDPHGGDAASVL